MEDNMLAHERTVREDGPEGLPKNSLTGAGRAGTKGRKWKQETRMHWQKKQS